MKRRVGSVITLYLLLPLLVGAVITGKTSDTNVEVDTTPKAARIIPYDGRGTAAGQRWTYSAGTTAKTATATGTAPFFSMCGSSIRTARLQKLSLFATTVTTAAYGDIRLTRTSSPTTGGTAVVLTQVPHDPTGPAGSLSLLNYYTALATAGTSAGVLRIFQDFLPIATPPPQLAPWILFWDQGSETESVVLRGISQCAEASFGTATTTPTITLSVTWTEE